LPTFYIYNKIIFLTQGNNRNLGGIACLLNREVKPVLQDLNFGRYGLTVIFKQPLDSLEEVAKK
jgi:hypothetical protein